MNPALIYGILIFCNAIVNIPFVLVLIRSHIVALNFSELQAQATAVGTNATALQTQAAASDDVSNQAAIDAVTASLTSANATLAALIDPTAPQ